MKPKHLTIRVQQCLLLAQASNCPRRKFGALLLDPVRNVVLMDGYNGGPRGGGELCGDWCHRDGLKSEDVTIHSNGGPEDDEDCYIKVFGKHICLPDGRPLYWRYDAQEYRAALLAQYPPIQSGTRMEIGCHHAEMNVVCNAAASGVATAGAWLIVTGEPCMMCSKLIHHAGIVKVYVVDGGYAGHNGVGYLEEHGVEVIRTEGPQDPRGSDDLCHNNTPIVEGVDPRSDP